MQGVRNSCHRCDTQLLDSRDKQRLGMQRNFQCKNFFVGDFQRGLLAVIIATHKSRCVDRKLILNFDAHSR